MKNVKFLLAAAFSLFAASSMAQDFSSPQYAKYGETPELREKHILALNFLKEEYNNRNYNGAAHYLKTLLDGCPSATVSIYQRGVLIYKNKLNAAKTPEERTALADSILLMYDLRNQYFGDNGGKESAQILDQKAREILTVKGSDRPAVRKAFREAIAVAGDAADPETIVVYFSNLREDYKNTDQVMPEELISEYDRLSAILAKNPEATEFQGQLDTVLGLSGVASCENLEKIFRDKIAANPNDADLIGQAVSLMSRAKCDTDFYFEVAEKYYTIKPTSETALFLAQAFQNKNDYAKAAKYVNEALATEQDPLERQKLLVRMSLIQLVGNNVSGAAASARQARDLNPEDGMAYFLLAQCYVESASACGGIAGAATYWAAYDTVTKAIELLQNNPEYLQSAKAIQAGCRSRFPTAEELFFNELKEGARYTVNCGTAAGIATTVRAR